MNDEERAMFYEAGYLAGVLSWHDPDVIQPSELSAMGPAGDPVIVMCGDDGLTTAQARAVAAINGAGRAIRVVTAEALAPEVAAWLPEGSLHQMGSPYRFRRRKRPCPRRQPV